MKIIFLFLFAASIASACSIDKRTYSVVKWIPAFDKAGFALVKAQGVIQSSIETLRKSINGKQVIMKWCGDSPPMFNGLADFKGTRSELNKYLNDNDKNWYGVKG